MQKLGMSLCGVLRMKLQVITGESFKTISFALPIKGLQLTLEVVPVPAQPEQPLNIQTGNTHCPIGLATILKGGQGLHKLNDETVHKTHGFLTASLGE